MKRTSRKGFTLIELLVVVALLALTAAAAIPSFVGDARLSAEERTAREIARKMEGVRDAARQSGAPASFILSPADARYWIVTRDSSSVGAFAITNGVALQTQERDRTEIRFTPSGMSSPAAIVIHGTLSYTVSTDPLNGDVRIRVNSAR